MRQLTKSDVRLNGDRLFAHGQGFTVPSHFANRDESQEDLIRFIKAARDTSDSCRIYCVSDLLGSGKTFLLSTVLNKLQASSVVPVSMSDGLEEGLSIGAASLENVRLTDEWDIKVDTFQEWSTALEVVCTFARQFRGTLVIIGDRTLKCPFVKNKLEAVAIVKYVDLEPLSPIFFAKALAARLDAQFKEPTAPFIDEELLDLLVPDWSETGATFRSVLKILYELSQVMPNTKEPCAIGRQEVAGLLGAKIQPQSKFVNDVATVRKTIVDILRSNRGNFTSLSDAQVADILHEDPGAPKLHEVITTLVRQQILVPVGVPNLDDKTGTYHTIVGPYLPGGIAALLAYGGGG